jgi:hypothetical protein
VLRTITRTKQKHTQLTNVYDNNDDDYYYHLRRELYIDLRTINDDNDEQINYYYRPRSTTKERKKGIK